MTNTRMTFKYSTWILLPTELITAAQDVLNVFDFHPVATSQCLRVDFDSFPSIWWTANST